MAQLCAERTNSRPRALTPQGDRPRLTGTIETRGDLPPLAATLNKELKSDSPGGAARPAFFVSIIVTFSRSPLHARLRSPPSRSAHAPPGAGDSASRSKRIAQASDACACRWHAQHVHRPSRGCRPGTAPRPGARRALGLERSDTHGTSRPLGSRRPFFTAASTSIDLARRPFTEARP